MSNVLKENYKKLVDALAPYFGGASDFNDLTNKPEESGTIDMSEIVTPLPTPQTNNYPIGFDESGAEYQVSWYKRASDGKVKPVYRKTLLLNAPSAIGGLEQDFLISDIERVFMNQGQVLRNDGWQSPMNNYQNANNFTFVSIKKKNDTMLTIFLDTSSNFYGSTGIISISFTKTSDEWREI